MTLDEAIKHCEEVAEANDKGLYDAIALGGAKFTQKEIDDCQQCAADHRQLAEWLTELKERRKHTYIAPCGNCCKDCPYSLERVIDNG